MEHSNYSTRNICMKRLKGVARHTLSIYRVMMLIAERYCHHIVPKLLVHFSISGTSKFIGKLFCQIYKLENRGYNYGLFRLKFTEFILSLRLVQKPPVCF